MKRTRWRCAAFVAVSALSLPGCETALNVVNCTAVALLEDDVVGPQPADTVDVYAIAETEPVTNPCDAADDPAIWVDLQDPRKGKLVVTNKTGKLGVHSLDGATLVERRLGRLNNVDIRDRIPVSGSDRIVVVASNRSRDTIDAFELDPISGELSDLVSEPIASFESGIYGICLYRSTSDGNLYAFANGKDGEVGQWRLDDDGRGKLRGELVRTWSTGTSVEGCVADDANGWLYLGAEEQGIWRYDARPGASSDFVVVDTTGIERESGGHLHGDVEGLALYVGRSGDPADGYLIASSQGNSTYVVYDRAEPHAYRGTFRIVARAGIDGTQFTDGIDVTSRPMEPGFPSGMLVVQDGSNTNPDGSRANQNFKLVPWDEVARALDL